MSVIQGPRSGKRGFGLRRRSELDGATNIKERKKKEEVVYFCSLFVHREGSGSKLDSLKKIENQEDEDEDEMRTRT